MILDELGAYLAANITGPQSLTLGTNLYLGRLPDSPDTCVAIFETGGTLPEQTMGGTLAVLERPRVQVVTRRAGYSDARTLAYNVWNTLEGVANESLSGTRFLRVSAVQSPYPLERDSSDRIIIVQNFDVIKTP